MQSAEQFSGYSSQLGCGQGSGQPLIMPIQLNHCSLTRCKATLLARVEDFPVKKKERKKKIGGSRIRFLAIFQFFPKYFADQVEKINQRKSRNNYFSREKRFFSLLFLWQTSRFKRTLSSFVSLSSFLFPFFFNLADSLATAKFQRPS